MPTTTKVRPLPDRLAQLATLTLAHGSHPSPESGLCAMEAAAWLAGEKHSDHPACTCPVVAAYVRRLNDGFRAEDRQRLVAYLPKLLGTVGSVAVRRQRMYLAADAACRIFAPIALEARGYKEHAAKLRALDPVVDKASAQRARAAAAAAAAAVAAYAAADAYAVARARLADEALALLDRMLAAREPRVVTPKRKRARESRS